MKMKMSPRKNSNTATLRANLDMNSATRERNATRFLAGGGEMGKRMRAHDWSSTSLGPPETWPVALRVGVNLIINSPESMFLAWGSDLLFFFNDAYRPILGPRIGHALGSPLPELWSDVWEQIRPIVEKALAGESSRYEDLPLNMARYGEPEQTSWSFSYSPLYDEDGAVAGMFCTTVETTERVRDRRRKAFQRALDDRLRDLAEPREVMAAAAEMLGRHLRVGRCGYADIDSAAEFFTVEDDWTDGKMPSLVGRHRIDAFGVDATAEFQKGCTLRVDDARADPRIGIESLSAYAAVGGVRSLLATPLLHGNRWVAAMFVHESTARRWTDEDEAILLVVAERTWAAVERARSAARERETEARFRTLFERAPGFIAILRGRRLVFEFVNEAYAQLFGGRDFIGRTVRESFPDLVDQRFFGWLDQVYATGERFIAKDIPVRMQHSPEVAVEERVLDFIYQPVIDETGQVTGIFIEGYDVTDVHVAHQALRELNADLERQVEQRTILRSRFWQISPDLLGILNGDGYFESSNPAWHAILGWSENEVRETSIFELVHPDDLERTQAGFEQLKQGNPIRRFENRYRAKDGGYRWFAWSAAPQGGEYFCNGRDITADKAATDALDQSQARLRTLFETSYQLQGFLALDGRVIDINATALAAIESTLDDVVGTLFWETPWFTATAGIPDFVRGGVEAASKGTVLREVISVNVASGLRTYDFSIRPIRDSHGTIIAIAPEAVDITEQRQISEALRQSQKLEAMGQLTGGVAHDFNNLLTPILGSLDLLHRRRVGTEREQRLIDGALRSADRAKTLVQRLLAFARRQPLQSEAVDLLNLVTGMADLLASTSGPHINVRVHVAEDLPPAKADRNQLEMAILNLAVNARDAMPNGGDLTISATQQSIEAGHRSGLNPERYLRLSIADTGLGMDEATLTRAIEPFFSTKGVGKGTGLGLSMAHGLASQSGGALTISSQPGLGTQVDLWLPISSESVKSIERDVKVAHAKIIGTALLVEDDELVRLTTADMLSDMGYAVVEANSGEAALRLIDEGLHVDVLVTDHLMPGMTGVELARAVLERRPATRVLVVSGYAEVDGLAADLPRLIKPFRQADLVESVAGLWLPASR